MADGILDSFELLDLFLRQMFAARIAVERGFQHLELSVPIDQTTTHKPLVNDWRKAEQWEADRYAGHQHRDRFLGMDREP